MLLAYIDEIGEPGAFVSREHKSFNTSPTFGYAGFVIPEQNARRFGEVFTWDKRQLFATELANVEHPGRWERKGSDIFRPHAWEKFPAQIRVFRGLVTKLSEFGGSVFFYADEKQRGTPKQVRLTREERESAAMQETVNRLCRHAAQKDQNLLILMDAINEHERASRVASSYAHIFSRAQDFPEMRSAVEPPMHVDSALSSNIQFADWIAAAVGRAISYQLDERSQFSWVPQALSNHMHHCITHESKLHFWQSSINDLHNHEVFRRERPYLARTSAGSMTPENLARLQKVKFATARSAGGK